MIEILIFIVLWIIAASSVSLFFLAASKKSDIQTVRFLDFKNSKVIKEDPTLFDEIKVVEREKEEFIQAIVKGDVRNAIEEYYDVKQSMENCLDMIGVLEEEIIEGQAKHIKKMLSRGWNFK